MLHRAYKLALRLWVTRDVPCPWRVRWRVVWSSVLANEWCYSRIQLRGELADAAKGGGE